MMTIISLNFKFTKSCNTWAGMFCSMCFCWTWLARAMQNMVFPMVCRRKAVTLPWAATFLSWPDPESHPHIIKPAGTRISSWIWLQVPGSNLKIGPDFNVGPPVWDVFDQISFITNYSGIPQYGYSCGFKLLRQVIIKDTWSIKSL